MTKAKYLNVILLALFTFALAGCSSGTDAQTAAQLQQIQTKLDELETKIDSGTGDTTAESESTTEAVPDVGADTSTGDTVTSDPGTTSTDSTYDQFSQALADLDSRANSAITTSQQVAVPAGSYQERFQAYLSAKAPLEALENEADRLEDQIEASCGFLECYTSSLYSLVRQAEQIEERLDNAQDALERRMGVDD